MYTNDDKLVYKDQVFQIVGCAIEVLKSHRPNHGSRAWVDVELFADHEVPCGSDSQFQTSQTRVGANHLMNWCSLVSIRGCTDAGRNLRPTILWVAYESNKGGSLAHLLEKAVVRKLRRR